jgi:hypothetical protein
MEEYYENEYDRERDTHRGVVSGNPGCMHYVRGDLDYLQRTEPIKEKNVKVDYRVNVNYYGIRDTTGYLGVSFMRGEDDLRWIERGRVLDENGDFVDAETRAVYEFKEQTIIRKEMNKFLEENDLRLKEVFKLKPEDLFLNISAVIHSTQTKDDDFCAAMGIGYSLTIVPMKIDEYNIHYAIDVYDKRMLGKIVKNLNKTNASGTVWEASGKTENRIVTLKNLNLQGYKPLGRYEYTRVIVQRGIPFGIIFPVAIIVGGTKTKTSALTRAVKDMNGEFLEDINTGGFNQIVYHNLERDGRPTIGGLVMSPEQVGEDSTSLLMASLSAGSMLSGALSNYAHGGDLAGSLKSMGREVAVEAIKGIVMEYVNSEFNARLADEEKNLYVALVKDAKTKKWLFGGAAKSMADIDTRKYTAKKLPVKTARKYFVSKKDMERWIAEREKWTGR